jgi:Putative zinc-finger
MTRKHRPLSRAYSEKDRMEELCCLSVQGDLSPEESIQLEQHLKECGECRDLIQEFERLMFFDLPAAAALRLKDELPESVEIPSEEILFARFTQKVRTEEHRKIQQASALSGITYAPCPVPRWKRVRQFAKFTLPLLASAAAGLVIASLGFYWHAPVAPISAPAVSAQTASIKDIEEWKNRALSAERRTVDSDRDLIKAKERIREDSIRIGQLLGRDEKLAVDHEQLQAKLDQQRADLSSRTAELGFVRSSLTEETSAKEDFQRQLQEIDAQVAKQKSELAHLEQIAATVPVQRPLAEHEIGTSEAKEILGARDLHIVDVYDIDHQGKASQVYGRVYLVNHNLLMFYAFDLPIGVESKKAVAFQAWGYRQPDSHQVESLGLFILDNAKWNRWELRVSDPQLLSRIDTLFVTKEPPGGSRSPSGRHLLSASLAGAPNHP